MRHGRLGGAAARAEQIVNFLDTWIGRLGQPLIRRKAPARRAKRFAGFGIAGGGFSALQESFGDVAILHDRSGAVLRIRGDCRGVFGCGPEELAGRGLFDHVHVADRPAFLQALGEASFAPGPFGARLRLRASSLDRGAYAEPVFAPLDMRARRCGAKGKRVLAVFRRLAEASAPQGADAAATPGAADLARDHFLANMSHELRTPLNAIIGFAEILGDAEQTPRDPARQREYAAIIRRSGQHLLSVVNCILDLSKIHSGCFTLTPAPFRIAPLVDVCCDMVMLEAEERGVALARACAGDLGEMVGDMRACKQILINLLSNAVKFTPAQGEVLISVRAEGDRLTIAVADSGVGIAAQDLAQLGAPFFQGKGALDRPYEGTGLGLSIVSGLVGLHGGSIAVASEPDQGTCVTVRLPLDCRAAADAARGAAAIETIARYRRNEARSGPAAAIQDAAETMVKKIA